MGFLVSGGGDLVRCVCRAEEDHQRAYRQAQVASNLTPRLQRQTFGAFDVQRAPEAHSALSAFADDPYGWIVLLGTTGVGKTHLLAATADRLLAHGRQPLYVVAPDFLAYLRGGMDETTDGAKADVEARIQQAIQADVLLLDDLGAEYETRWAEEQFFRVINGRYNTEAPTIVATNLALTQLSERVASRLKDRALVRRFVLTGGDYRDIPVERR